MPTDERVGRVARELYEMFTENRVAEFDDLDDASRARWLAYAARVLRVADAPQIPDTSGRYIVDGTTYLRASGDTLEEAVERWQKLANGGYPDGWEDTEEGEEGLIVGGCESCGRPILDGERYAVDDDLVYECSECMEPPLPDEAVGGLMEGIERTGGGA